MEIALLHHVSVNVLDLERAKRFYTEVLGLRELARPPFPFPGAWYQVGDNQQLHLIVAPDPLLRGEKGVDTRAAHLALRIASYAKGVEHFRSHGYSEDLPDLDLKKMRLQPHGTAGFPQIYVADPDRNLIELNATNLDTGVGQA